MNIETLATLKHINVRKEGSDEKILAIDVRFNCQIPSDVLIEFHPTLRTMLWTHDGEPRFNRLIESINLIGQTATTRSRSAAWKSRTSRCGSGRSPRCQWMSWTLTSSRRSTQ